MGEEISYLENTIDLLKMEINRKADLLPGKKSKLIAFRKNMLENAGGFAGDFDRSADYSQYLPEASYQAADYCGDLKQIEKYQKMVDSPYFGRFDFIEEGCRDREKIYIGLCNVIDPKTGSILVHDWRAPISGMFYRYELGKVSYDAPGGAICGDTLLKRQYKIKHSQLKYFYDCSIKINDEILQEVLSRNCSPKMKNIIETIQKEQDFIIRDTESELLMVQDVAGSGKTSIALHRIAFLLYNGAGGNLSSKNFIIISPNAVFSKYISSVLPELGEENVEQTTFDGIVELLLKGRLAAETRNGQIESLIASGSSREGELKRKGIEFKGSRVFARILDRLVRHYGRKRIPFEDVYYDGRIIETRQGIKNAFLNKNSEMPMAIRLKRIENTLLDKVHPLQKKRRLEKIEKIVEKSEGHELEVRAFSRLLSIKEAGALVRRLHRFTRVDYLSMYKLLFSEPGLLIKLGKGLPLPEGVKEIILSTRDALESGYIHYEDCAPLLYLGVKTGGSDLFPDVRHVFIDEAQDYYPMHYELFNLLFKSARYTILGDIHQAVEKEADNSLYDVIAEILDREKVLKVYLNKSYRSSYEINAFTRGVLAGKQDFVSFWRHGKRPEVVRKDTRDLLDRSVARDIDRYLGQGFESIAVICKTMKEAEEVGARLNNLTGIRLVGPKGGDPGKGPLVIPSYMAKGLEFDVVMVYGASSENYTSHLDRKLLYIAGTRALHRLALYYTGERSPFIRCQP